MMIPRIAMQYLRRLSKGWPVVAVTGPRQSGKTTLVRAVFPAKSYVSLEDPDQMAFARQDPRGFLARFPGGAILDEVQRCPELFSYLQTRVDAMEKMGLFVLTGSQQFGLLSGITQSLAGRAALLQLLPLSVDELKKGNKEVKSPDVLLYQGGYPPLYSRRVSPASWYANYVMTYIERDVRQLINIKDLSVFRRFLKMCAARTAQLLNLSSLANDCSITHNTAKAWISVLEASYLVFLMHPHHKNFGKRLVKTPKLYFYDTGLAAWLLGIEDAKHMAIHSMRGELFESFIISEMLKARFNKGQPSNLFFWRDNTGNEVDVLIEKGEALSAVEIKSGQTATEDYFTSLVKWRRISGSAGKQYLIYSGSEQYTRSHITLLPWNRIADLES
jgi:hypothetical protein